jgi:hypothetical protein
MRLAVTILVTLQLLMPTGLCLCRQHNATAPQSQSSPVECDAVQKRCSCKCKHLTAPAKRATEQALVNDEANVPGRDSHEPGCPAVQAADYFFAAQSNETTSTLNQVAWTEFVASIESGVEVSNSTDFKLRSSRCPIYLTYAILLI